MEKMIPDYYKRDKQLGDVVTINGENAYYKYNADLIRDEETPGQITNEYQYKTENAWFFKNRQEITPAVHTWYWYVGGETRADAMRNVSALLAVFRECEVQREDEPYIYSCILQTYYIEETGVDNYFMVSISCEAIKHGEKITIVATADNCYRKLSDVISSPSLRFNNPGTVPAVISIYFESDGTIEANHNLIIDNTIRIYVQPSITLSIDAETGFIDEFGRGVADVLKTFNGFIKAVPGDNAIVCDGITADDLTNERLSISFTPVYA